MSAMIDLTGHRFGNLTVLSRASNMRSRAAWLCKCHCGVEVTVVGYSLRGGLTKSCGCQRPVRAQRMGRANRQHGKTNTPEFRCWAGLISRCTNPKDYRFKRYGGRGIRVCDRWLESFESFLADMGSVPFPGAELDRRDNDGHYEPDNCRWVTAKVNNNNRSSTRQITYGGRTQSITLWAEEIGMNPATLRVRLEAGWSVDRAITEPVRGEA